MTQRPARGVFIAVRISARASLILIAIRLGADNMATVTPTRQVPDTLNHQVLICTYTGLQSGDDGAPVELAQFADRTVQVAGAFGVGGNVRIEGSLDGTNYAVLTDPQGNALDINTAKIECITELVRYIRPRVTAGDGTTALSVTLLIKGA